MMDLVIRHGWRPGLLGEIVRAHGLYYNRDWGFGPVFEAKVARELGEFFDRYTAETDRLLFVDCGGCLAGALTVDGGDPALEAGLAHLRWFIVVDGARGSGIGRKLMAAAVDFMREARFRKCFLTTFAGLDAARHLYENAGFFMTDESEAATWGTSVREQRFELDLERR
jgi:GNAT superfamily N-acetyltransferase